MPARTSQEHKSKPKKTLSPVVYFLQPKRKSRKSYIGYTVDLHHRWRQHRGEIKGGAKRTRGWKDAVVVAFVTGFPDKNVAQSFEWWAKRKTSLIQRQLGSVQRQKVHVNQNADDHCRLKNFQFCLYHPKFKNLPLRIINTPTEQQLQEHE